MALSAVFVCAAFAGPSIADIAAFVLPTVSAGPLGTLGTLFNALTIAHDGAGLAQAKTACSWGPVAVGFLGSFYYTLQLVCLMMQERVRIFAECRALERT